MLTHIITNVLYVAIAAGMVFQFATAGRYAVRVARTRRASRPKVQPTVAAQPPVLRVRKRRPRDYRLALKAARASVAA